MLDKSLKWMLLTLAAFFAVFFAVRGVVRAIFPPEPSPVPTATAVQQTAVPQPPTADETPQPTEPPQETPLPHYDTEAEALRAYVEAMPLKDKLGQLVMFGFSGVTEPSSEFSRVLSNYHVGNIVLYGGNINRTGSEDGGFLDAARLTSRLEKMNPTEIPFLVSIDIEGGRVQRFKWEDSPVSANTLGKKNDHDLAYSQFLAVGQTLRDVGINMNLAPVLDVATDPMKTFLTTRIISSNAQTAAAMGSAIIEGLNEAACLSTAKHFPGHGATTEDTHETTPIVNKSLEELESYELIPFRAGIEAGVDAMLVAHILYPKLDETHIASMSERIITDLLRDEMGFTGIVMSDDFRMGGLTLRYDVGEAAVQFLLAGGDMILCGPRTDLQVKIMDALTAAAEDGTLSDARINESVIRILEKKCKVTDWTPMPQESTAE